MSAPETALDLAEKLPALEEAALLEGQPYAAEYQALRERLASIRADSPERLQRYEEALPFLVAAVAQAVDLAWDFDAESIEQYLDDGIAQARAMQEASKKPHSGDCTKQPYSCLRCLWERYVGMVRRVREALKGKPSGTVKARMHYRGRSRPIPVPEDEP